MWVLSFKTQVPITMTHLYEVVLMKKMFIKHSSCILFWMTLVQFVLSSWCTQILFPPWPVGAQKCKPGSLTCIHTTFFWLGLAMSKSTQLALSSRTTIGPPFLKFQPWHRTQALFSPLFLRQESNKWIVFLMDEIEHCLMECSFS